MSHKPTAAAGGSGSMRSLLSASGQTAYDAATNNSWFSVSSADYAAVYAGLASTTKVGMDDSQVTTASPSAFVGTYGVTLPQAYATVSANRYVVGMVVRTMGTAGTFRPYISTTYKGSTYTAMGTNTLTTTAVATPQYYLCKAPSLQSSISYVAIGPRNVGGGNWACHGTASSWTGAGYTASMSPASWTTWNNATPIQQWLVTTTQP